MKIDNQTMLEDFTKMCKEIAINRDGKFFCMFENLEYDDDFQYIVSSNHYPILKEKMNKLVELVNNDLSLLDKDVETELWQML